MFTPDFYKTDHRKLTVRELIRWWGLWRLPRMYLATRKPPAIAGFWMPALWADLECPEAELSTRFWAVTTRHRATFGQLGFASCGCARIKPALNLQPLYRDDGKITYVGRDRTCIGGMFYSRFWTPAPINREQEQVVIWFTSVFDKAIVSCTNSRRSFDPVKGEKGARVSTDDPALVHAKLISLCRSQKGSPRTFADEPSIRDWFDGYVTRTFQSRASRGLFVKMTEDEIAEARSRMPPRTWTASSPHPSVE